MSRIVMIGGLVLLALLAAVFAWRLLPGQAIVAAPGDELRYDDFGYSVEGLRRAPSIGDGGAAVVAQGEFVIVTLGAHNHGQRIDGSFDPTVLRLIAEDGTVYLPGAAGSAALATIPIPAGGSCTAEVPFDVAPGTRAVELRMQFEGPIFELVYMLINGRKALALPESTSGQR